MGPRFASPPLFERGLAEPIAQPVIAPPPRNAVPMLAGIAEDELGSIAWLGTDRVGVRPVRVGEEIGGWTVSRIAATQVELVDGARVEVLGFFADEQPD